MLGDSVRRRGRAGKGSVPFDPDAGRKRRGRGAWPWVLAAVLLPFAVGYALAALVLFPPTEDAAALEGAVAVPDLVGRTVDEAERELSGLGLGALAVTALPHPDAPAGEIIAQDPLAGQHLRPGAGARVAVSAGPPRARVPDITGFPLERARALLQRLGFQVVSVERESATPTGRVIGIAPPAGSEQRLPAIVTVIVSIGEPQPESDELYDTLPGERRDTTDVW